MRIKRHGDGGSESSPSPLGGENYRLLRAMCWAGHNWADLGMAGGVFRVCWGSAGTNLLVRPAVGHAFRARTPCPNPPVVGAAAQIKTDAGASAKPAGPLDRLHKAGLRRSKVAPRVSS